MVRISFIRNLKQLSCSLPDSGKLKALTYIFHQKLLLSIVFWLPDMKMLAEIIQGTELLSTFKTELFTFGAKP
jgi:hypothetical protein